VDCKKWGYQSVEELVKWRIFDRTGAGLMAELGSHQLDAASIFLGKKHPTAVQGVGKVSYFTEGPKREVEDHIFLTFEFGKDAGNAIVTYSSICTNAFDGYGEQVMGTRGTMIVQEEREAYVFRDAPGVMSKDTRVSWAEQRMDRPAMAAGSTKQWAAGVDVADTLTSRGYREEQEHMAFLIRHPELYKNPDPAKRQLPRCHGRVAMADAVVALCSNLAMRKNKRIEFKPEWFEAESDSAPEKEV
jgi:predicted dehydrogenase